MSAIILGTELQQPAYTSQATVEQLEKESSLYEKDKIIDFSEDVNISKAQLLLDVVKQLRSGRDLYRISLPSALLAPVSMLEYVSNYITPNNFILNGVEQSNAEQRFLAVVQWWLSNLVTTPRAGFLHAKPYNAILGEIFRAKWVHDDGSKTLYLAEQVSHHPPISSVFLTNKAKGFSLHATLLPKSKFHTWSGSASTIIDGDVFFKIDKFDEEYKIEFPSVLARGLILGTQCLEVHEDLKIECKKTGYSCCINFQSKTDNPCKGEIFYNGHALYQVHGKLVEVIYKKDLKTKEDSVLVNAKQVPHVARFVVPIHKQMTIESRRVWHRITQAISQKDFLLANEAKNDVEEEQRAIRKEREHKGQEWENIYFIKEGKNWTFKYANSSMEELESSKLGLWEVTQEELDFISKQK